MLEINLSKINKTYNGVKVLDDFNLELQTGEHIGLIGPNGSGKTTTFNIIEGKVNIDSGFISIRKNARIGQLSQIPEFKEENILAIDVLLKPLEYLKDKEKEINDLIEVLKDKPQDKLIQKLSNLQEDFYLSGGYSIDEKVSKIKKSFKLTDELLERKFNDLSGGEKTLVTLASLILGNYDILLLDEPTNHLDIDTLAYLEGFFKTYKGSIIVSSHDRYFLDKVVNKVIFIEDGHSVVYNGNYSYYLKESERRELLLFEKYKVQQKQIEEMKKAIKRLYDWGNRSDNPSLFRRAKAIQKRLDRLEVIELKEEKKDLPITFKEKNRSGNTVLKIDNLNLYIGNKELLKNSNMFIGYGSRVGLIGKNGVGKTTLIKEILKGDNPSITLGKNIILGFIPQEIRFSKGNMTIYEYARNFYEGSESDLRKNLFRFYFNTDSLTKKIDNLSGGEKVRLKLFELITKKANFIVLDEPTNHIDIDTREILESALLDFKGTLLFVSHDRYFINKIATSLAVINNNTIKEVNLTYEEYQEKELQKEKQNKKEEKVNLIVPKEIKEYVSNSTIYDINGYSKTKLYRLVKKNVCYYLKISKNDLTKEYEILNILNGILPVPKVMSFIKKEDKYYLVTKEIEGQKLSSITNKEDMFNLIIETYMMIYSVTLDSFPYKENGNTFSYGDLYLDNILVKNNKIVGLLSSKNASLRENDYDLKIIISEIEKYLGKEYVNRFYDELGLEKTIY